MQIVGSRSTVFAQTGKWEGDKMCHSDIPLYKGMMQRTVGLWKMKIQSRLKALMIMTKSK